MKDVLTKVNGHSMDSIDDLEIFERQINKILIYNLLQQLPY